MVIVIIVAHHVSQAGKRQRTSLSRLELHLQLLAAEGSHRIAPPVTWILVANPENGLNCVPADLRS